MIGEGLIKRNDGTLPPKVRNLLNKVGNETITKMEIVRYPIKLSKIFNLISLGRYQKFIEQNGFDKLFHLSLYLNDKYILEKNEVINMEIDNPLSVNESESMSVNLSSKQITFNELLDKTKSYMGDKNFSNYDARKNNCQVFITSVLKSNGLLTDANKGFINQDVEKIFEGIPSIAEKLIKGVTDTASIVDRQIYGEGVNSSIGNVPLTQGFNSLVYLKF